MAVTTDIKTPLGKYIIKNLYLNGKNQAWLAEQLGTNASYISLLCNKITCPKPATLLKISEVLNIEVEELYNAVAETTKYSSKQV